MNKHVLLAALAAASMTSQTATAAPFGIYDPRSLAMGGIGVSTATSSNASFYNPAMLSATREKDDFSLQLPIVAVQIADADKLSDDIDKLDTSGNALSNAINQFNTAQTQANAGSVATALGAFRTDLNTVNNKSLDAGLFAGTLLAVPGKTLGFAVHLGARADFSTSFTYAGSDDTLLGNFQTAAQTYANTGNPADLATLLTTYGSGGTLQDPNLQSRVNLRGLVREETGVSLSHHFESLGGIAIGVTPKNVKTTTVDYNVSAQTPDIDLDLGKKEYSDFNADIGVAKDYDGRFKTGFVIKNVMSKTYDTVLGNTIEMKPQMRIGASHHTDWTTVGIDIDVTKNKPAGLEKESQYLGIGAELDLFSTLQLRLGYRNDLTGNRDATYSIGVGFSPIAINLDIGIAGNDNEVMAGLQFGVSF